MCIRDRWKDGSAYRAGKYRIECSPSETGDDWAVVYEGDEIGARGVAAFAPAEARRVRVTLLEYATEGKQPSIHEVEIYADMLVYKDALTAAIQQAVAAYGRLGEDLSAQGYNSETAAVYLDALARAEAAEGSDNADKAETTGALAALKFAIAGLSKEPVKPEQSVEGVTLDQQAAALEVGETCLLYTSFHVPAPLELQNFPTSLSPSAIALLQRPFMLYFIQHEAGYPASQFKMQFHSRNVS